MEHEEAGARYALGYWGGHEAGGVDPEAAVSRQQPYAQQVGELGVGYAPGAPQGRDALGQRHIVGIVGLGDEHHLLPRGGMAAHGVEAAAHKGGHSFLALQPALPYIFNPRRRLAPALHRQCCGRRALNVAPLEVGHAPTVVERVQAVAHAVARLPGGYERRDAGGQQFLKPYAQCVHVCSCYCFRYLSIPLSQRLMRPCFTLSSSSRWRCSPERDASGW